MYRKSRRTVLGERRSTSFTESVGCSHKLLINIYYVAGLPEGLGMKR